MVNFDCSRKDHDLIIKIVRRALTEGKKREIQDLDMDITAVHCNDSEMDLEKLLAFDDFNFNHDIYGIRRHINRNTGKLTDCFSPRCTKPSPLPFI